MKKHVIAGKDRRPEETITRIKKTLKAEGYVPKILSERNNGGLFSILIGDKHSDRFTANGKGITRELALASAYGEFMERFMTHFYVYDLWLTKDTSLPWVYDEHEVWTSKPESLIKSLNTFYPDKILQKKYCYDINQSPNGESYCFLPFKTLKDETCHIPVNFWRELYTSNGLAYGNNLYEARVQALCEIMERHVKYRVIGEGLSLPDIPDNEFVSNDIYSSAKELLAHHGLLCRVFDASLDEGYPVTAFLIYTPDRKEAFLSFGAHPDKKIALQRTITEAFQGRDISENEPDFLNMVSGDTSLTGLPENLESHFINSTGILHKNIFKSVPSFPGFFQSFHGNSEEEWHTLCGLVESAGYTILTRDILWENHTACQIIIPGFSEMYPFEDLLQKDLKGYCNIRNEIISLMERDPVDIERLIELFETEHFEPEKGAGESLGLLLPPSSPWSRYSVRDILFLLVLAEEGPEKASFYLDEIGHVSPDHPELPFSKALINKGKKKEILRCLFENCPEF
jgi:ribosomal protein S12 methylthiotransferase accessory factor